MPKTTDQEQTVVYKKLFSYANNMQNDLQLLWMKITRGRKILVQVFL
jgi:hypothetical protein